MYLDFSRTLAFITSMTLTLGMYIQVIKIFRTKSAQDFTLILILALLMDELAWLNYGIAIKEWPVFLLGFLSLPAAILALVGYLKYRKGEKRDELEIKKCSGNST